MQYKKTEKNKKRFLFVSKNAKDIFKFLFVQKK